MGTGRWVVVAETDADPLRSAPRAAGPFDDEQSARAFADEANGAVGGGLVWVGRLYEPGDVDGFLAGNR